MLIGVWRGFVSGQGSGWAADCSDQLPGKGWALRALNEYTLYWWTTGFSSLQRWEFPSTSCYHNFSMHSDELQIQFLTLGSRIKWIWKKKGGKEEMIFLKKFGSGKQQTVLELFQRKRQGFNCQESMKKKTASMDQEGRLAFLRDASFYVRLACWKGWYIKMQEEPAASELRAGNSALGGTRKLQFRMSAFMSTLLRRQPGALHASGKSAPWWRGLACCCGAMKIPSQQGNLDSLLDKWSGLSCWIRT